MICQHCKFWRESSEEHKGTGACRRHPPQIVARVYTLGRNENAGRYEAEVESSTESEWPQTKAADWCGDFVASRI